MNVYPQTINDKGGRVTDPGRIRGGVTDQVPERNPEPRTLDTKPCPPPTQERDRVTSLIRNSNPP